MPKDSLPKKYPCPEPMCTKSYALQGRLKAHLRSIHGYTDPPTSFGPSDPSKPRQKSRADTSKLSLADLPPELIVNILHSLPTTGAFFALIRTSRYFHEVYSSQKGPILDSLARNAFPPLAREVLQMWRPGPHGLVPRARLAFEEHVGRPLRKFCPYQEDLSKDPDFFGVPELKRLSADRRKVEAITKAWLGLLPKGDDYHSAKRDSPVLQMSWEENCGTVYEFLRLPKGIVLLYSGNEESTWAHEMAEEEEDVTSGSYAVFDLKSIREESKEWLRLLITGVMRRKLPFEVQEWWHVWEYLEGSGHRFLAMARTKDLTGAFVQREVLMDNSPYCFLRIHGRARPPRCLKRLDSP